MWNRIALQPWLGWPTQYPRLSVPWPLPVERIYSLHLSHALSMSHLRLDTIWTWFNPQYPIFFLSFLSLHTLAICFPLYGVSDSMGPPRISLQCPNHSGLLSVLFPSLSNFDFMFLYFRDHFVTTLNSFFFSSLPSPVITSKFLYFLQSTTPPNHPFAKQRLNFLLNRKSWRGLQLSNP